MTEPDAFDRRLTAAGDELRAIAMSPREPTRADIHGDLRRRSARRHRRRAVGAGVAAAIVLLGGRAWTSGARTGPAPDHDRLGRVEVPHPTTATTASTAPTGGCDAVVPTVSPQICTASLGQAEGPMGRVAITVTLDGERVPGADGWLLPSSPKAGDPVAAIPFLADSRGQAVVEAPPGTWTVHAMSPTTTSSGTCPRDAVGQRQVRVTDGRWTSVSVHLRMASDAWCPPPSPPRNPGGG